MKAFLAILAGLSARVAFAHYTIPDFISGGDTSADWQYIRKTANWETNAPLIDVTDPEIRCYELDMQNTPAATGMVTVSAGDTVGFKANNDFYHPGYFSVYMSLASPAADSPDAATGQTWFKVWEDPPVLENGALVFPSQTIDSFTFTIPKALPSGQYLVRAEQIALHVASTFGGAQFYLSCAQINVANGGSGTPSPLVSFPGVYTGYEPGILINVYDLPANFTGYQSPGPAVWSG